MSPIRQEGDCRVDHRVMEVSRSLKDKAKATRTGSRLQNRACDQCRRAKRRCDLAEAGVDGDPIQNDGPCKLCIRKNLQCTSHWSQLQQTVSSSRQELRHISQNSATYTALQNQLTVRNIGSAGLSSTTQGLNDSIDNLYIAAKQLSIYITAWEWTWLHYLGPSSAPLGVGIDVVTLPRFGLLSPTTNRIWDSISRIDRPPHISPNFFFTMCACDEAYRHSDRFKRPPPMADQISNQALQYAILAYASQFGSQAPKHLDAEANKVQKEKDLDIAEAAWTRARNFIMTHATVHTFRMAYALHLFSSTCPPLRTARAESNPTLDSVFALQTGLKMLDELATELRSQQLEDLYTMGYFGADGIGMDDSLLLSADPDYRNRVSRAKALIGVAENLLWYSVVCDAAAATSYGLPLAVRGSSGDHVDLKAMIAAHPSWVSLQVRESSGAPVFSSMLVQPMPPYQPDQINVGVHGVHSSQPVAFSNSNVFEMLPIGMNTSIIGEGMPLRDWEPPQAEVEEPLYGSTDAAVESQFAGVKGPWTMSTGFDTSSSLWTRIVQRVQKAQKKVPVLVARLRVTPSHVSTVREFLALLQTAASAQVMVWQRTANFRHRLGDHNCSPESLVDQFHRTFHMILHLQSTFQPVLDLDPPLFYQLPTSAQTMVVMFINNAGLGTLHFLELCSTLEGSRWLQGANDKTWPRASMILQDLLRESRDIRAALRRKCALRITLARRMVQEQIKCTLLSQTPSPTRESSASAQSSYSGDRLGSTNRSHSDASSSSADWLKIKSGSNYIEDDGDTGSPIAISHQGSDLPQTEMLVSPLQIHTSRHPVPTVLADSLHMSFCALVPDALQEISQNGAVSPLTLHSLDSALLGLQDILGSVLSFGPFYHREPSIESLFSTRNWLAPDQPPMAMAPL